MLVVVHNERLLEILPEGMSLVDTFHAADGVARQAIVGIAGILSTSQLINVRPARNHRARNHRARNHHTCNRHTCNHHV